MHRDTSRFKTRPYDLLVIGGGINGAALAHLAAARGLRVALLEKGDFASGTSSASTKLIHGGIRYLENLEFDLVCESLKERSIQLRAAPHLVKPLEFIIPVYRGDHRPLWMMRLGVFLYDMLAGRYGIRRHRSLSAKEIFKIEPNLKPEGLAGGVLYYDAQMDDARLCLENVLMADRFGAHVANYIEAVSFIKENGRVTGVKAHDLLKDDSFEVRARRTVCAAGPWTNELLRADDVHAKKKVRTTKGIHLVYRGKISNRALLIPSKSDSRVFFVIPWMGNSLIGTTDTNYIGRPDHVEAAPEDVAYLVNETKRVFPGTGFKEDRIIKVFAGLRPLIRKGGSPSKVSRKHLFYQTTSGLIFVVGGKYTTYRKVAEDCLNRIQRCPGKSEFRLYGSGQITESPETVAEQYGLGIENVKDLMAKYGTRYRDVLKLIEERPSLKEKVMEKPPTLLAQLVYSVKAEMARTSEDVILRRLSVGYSGDVPVEVVRRVEQILATESDKSP